MSQNSILPHIPFTRLKLTLSAVDPIRLPGFPGSAFRGGFGAALRRACCTTNLRNCRECMLKTSCVYASVFETMSDHAGEDGYRLSDFPRPFIIEPEFPAPSTINPGELFSCHLLLIGRSIPYLPYFIYAFSELGKTGLGTAKGRYRILTVSNDLGTSDDSVFNGRTNQFENPPLCYEVKDFFSSNPKINAITIRFVTPARIKVQNRLTSELNFFMFMKNLFRRVLLVSQALGESWKIPDMNELLSQAKPVDISQSSLYWHDWTRYSSRQKETMNLGGFMGEISFFGNITPFLPFIRLGEYLHIGKACTFGLGKFHPILV